MGALQNAIVARLANDTSVLVAAPPAGLGLLVLDRWPLESGPGATPDAFTATGAMKRAAVVLDPDEVAHPDRRPGDDRKLVDVFPVVYLFAPAHSTGRAAIEAAYHRIEALFHNYQPVLPNGDRPIFSVTGGRTGARDDEGFLGSTRAEVRLRATWARALALA